MDDMGTYGKQVYQKGDLVHIGPMPEYMSHFPGAVDAIVIGSYKDIHGGRDGRHRHEFRMFVKGHGTVSWYPDSLFMPISRANYDLLDEWEAQVEQSRRNRNAR